MVIDGGIFRTKMTLILKSSIIILRPSAEFLIAGAGVNIGGGYVSKH